MTATYLDAIVAAHRDRAGADARSTETLIAAAAELDPARGFAKALTASGLSVIAEIKRRSPSKGPLAADLDPAQTARDYVAGGAACLSVLTDADYFGGSPRDLAAARAAAVVPAIRKDFTVSANDVCDTRLMGADCVLLIAAVLDDAELADFHALAHQVGIDALVEIHDEVELERALAVDATLIGVNQRDLVTFEVDQERALRMAPQFPDAVVSVAESGVGGPDDARALADGGYHAILVGESVVTAGDRVGAVCELIRAGAPRGER